MLNKPQLLRRLLALCGLLLLCSGVALSQLFQLQLLNGEKYVRRSAEFLTTTSTVSAARGEILDRYGRPLVTNNTGFSLVLIYSSFWDGNDKRFDTLLDLTHRIQTAAVDATAKQNAAKTAAATDTSSDTSADAADSTDTSSDTPTDTAQAVSADTAAIPSINDRLPITQSAPFTYNSASLTELSGYMKDSAKSLGLDAVTAAVDAAKQANETAPKTDENGNILSWQEKPVLDEYINCGFFVFKREFLDYLSEDESCDLEKEPLERLAAEGQLSMYRHTGFWQCMDTLRDAQALNSLWDKGNAPWCK